MLTGWVKKIAHVDFRKTILGVLLTKAFDCLAQRVQSINVVCIQELHNTPNE